MFIKIFSIQFFLVFFPSLPDLFSLYWPLPFLSFIVPIFGRKAPLMFPIFLKRSLGLPLLLFSSIIKHHSLKKAFLSLLAILWKSAFNWMYLSLSSLLFASLSSSAIRKASSEALPSCFCFSLEWFCLPPPVQYYGLLSINKYKSSYLKHIHTQWNISSHLLGWPLSKR